MRISLLLLLFLLPSRAFRRLMPGFSDILIFRNQITFVYGGDIWIVGKPSTAIKLTSSPGEESIPGFRLTENNCV
jgi:hypothetical protein